MFIELVDALRCPAAHEESWLVASATRTEARHIVEGMLGCPVCRAEYPIRRGVVDFRRAPRAGSAPIASAHEPAQAMRLAAFLDLAGPLGFAVLVGAWGAQAPALRELVELPLVLVDPPVGIEGEPGVTVIRCDGELALAQGAARGIAVDTGDAARLTSAVRATKVGGRIVAPATVPIPAGVRELVRDSTLWVGEKEPAGSPLVTLHVRRG
jgi:uncharacterized protein YbaR (Trm112 family)